MSQDKIKNRVKNLNNKTPDYVVSTLKGTLGAIPICGSAIAEIIGNLIPNQRIDRLTDLVIKLSGKINKLEQEIILNRLYEPGGIDILEEALYQSARALSEERRNQIASLLKNGLTKKEFDLIETKKLLLILSQLNDMEVLILRWYSCPLNEDKKFKNEFSEILKPIKVWIGASQEQKDKKAIFDSMLQHLTQVGLLEPNYPFVKGGELPEFDRSKGKFRSTGYKITLLGELLLRTIDFYPDK